MNSIVSEKRYIANKLGVPYESLSQSYLRAETVVGTQSVVDFTLQTNKVLAPVITERLLDLNDEFVITHFTMGIKHVADLTNKTEQLSALIETYDSSTFGSSGARDKFQQMGIASIYNGDLSFTIDRTEFIPNFPMRSFYRVPDALQVPTGNSKIGIPSFQAGATNFLERLSQTETSLYGFYPSEPTKIDGRQTIDLSVNLNSNADLTSDIGGTNYVVFEARGYLITNANN
tara:strand:- start:3468 stop:4160 length:693 start_codon:yes stop_codon:yes gene_type:complete